MREGARGEGRIVFGTVIDGEEDNVRCPVCRADYSHIREVYTRQGSDRYEGGGAYAGTVAKGAKTEWRRDALVIVFDGECAHAWAWVIQQHKGVNFVSVHRVPAREPDATSR